MHALLLPPDDLDQAGEEVGHVGPALLRPDQWRQLGKLGEGGSEASCAPVLLDFFVQFHL